MDPDQPPAAASEVPAQVQGEWFFRKLAAFRPAGVPWRRAGWGRMPRGRAGWVCTHLYPPDFMVNQPWSASQGCTAFFGPPLPAFEPADRFGAYGVVPASPLEGYRLAGGVAEDVNGFAEQAHGRLPELK